MTDPIRHPPKDWYHKMGSFLYTCMICHRYSNAKSSNVIQHLHKSHSDSVIKTKSRKKLDITRDDDINHINYMDDQSFGNTRDRKKKQCYQKLSNYL